MGTVEYEDDADVGFSSYGDECSYSTYLERRETQSILPDKLVAYFPVEGIKMKMLSSFNKVIVYSKNPDFDMNNFLYEKK